jgi:hypothetical protein
MSSKIHPFPGPDSGLQAGPRASLSAGILAGQQTLLADTDVCDAAERDRSNAGWRTDRDCRRGSSEHVAPREDAVERHAIGVMEVVRAAVGRAHSRDEVVTVELPVRVLKARLSQRGLPRVREIVA